MFGGLLSRLKEMMHLRLDLKQEKNGDWAKRKTAAVITAVTFRAVYQLKNCDTITNTSTLLSDTWYQ